MKIGTFTNFLIYSLLFLSSFFIINNGFAQTPVITPVPPLCENGAAIDLEDYVNDEDYEAAYWPFGTWSQYDLVPGSLPGLSGSMLNPSLIPIGGPYEVRWREYTVIGGTKVVDERFDFYIIESPVATATNDLLLCYGDNDGEITVSGSGGTSSPYNYSIDGGATFSINGTFPGLVANNYTVVVYDQSCYSDPITATVSQPNQITLTPSVTNVLCTGGNTGEIQINTIGGTPPLNYSIDGGAYQISNIFSNLTAGNYDIQVRDANLCTSSVTTVVVTEPTLINFTTTVLDVDCFGTSTGEITVNASGGTPPYQYSINGGGYQASNNFNGLSFGVYEIRVRDANGCISSPANVSVNEPSDAVSFTYAAVDVECNGDNTGIITITPSGGVSPYYYSINGGTNYQASNVFNGLAAGNYNVMIRDANSCETAIIVVNISEPALALNFSTNDINVSCYGASDGQITVNAVGGTPPYEYSSDNGVSYQSTPVFSGLSSGVYNMVVKDAANCVTSTTAVTITQPANELDFTYSHTDVDCYGDASGAISINAVGGTPSYQYSINGGATYQSPNTFSALSGGNYSLKVKDANSCETAVVDIILDEPAAAISFTISQTNINCYGDATGEIVVTATGGTPPYQYSRNNGASFQGSYIFQDLVAGNYNIVVRDANLCVSSATTVSISQPVAPLSFTTSIQNIDCYGGASGEIVINATGGTSSYLYSINGGADYQLSNTFTGLAAGNYDLRVKDANNCVTPINTVNISEPLSLVDFTYSTSNVSCFGGSDGQIIVSASGGTPPYSYSKNGGSSYQASNIFSNLNAASYDIMVKDANDCVSSAQTVVITQPSTSVNFIYTVHNVLCYGGSSGEIIITASGGTPGYEYSVDNGATYQANSTFTGLTAGNYYVRVRDAASCESSSALVTISQPALEISFTYDITNVSCFNGSNGIISINAAGGSAPYSYSKDGGLSFQTSSVFPGLTSGVYNLIVKDINNCQSAVTTVNVNEPSSPITFTTSNTDIECNGEASGQIIVTAVGGTPTYQFSINAGASFQSSNIFNNLYAGAYSVMVKDINNCSSAISFVTLSEPSNPVSFTTSVNHVLCNGDMTGEITINATGGVPGYQYSKNGGVSFQSSNVFANLTAGNYSIVVKDASDCESGIETVTVIEPDAPVSFSFNTTDVLCFGGSTGEIELNATGGTGPYQYSIDGGSSYQVSNQFSGLSAGTYSARVKDVNNCISSTVNVSVGQPASDVVHSADATGVLCFGGTSGIITINASGGTPGYTYSINGGVSFLSNNVFNGLSSGDYIVMVKDNNGCFSSPSTVTVGEPATAVSFTYNKIDVVCNGDDDGEINISAFGGTPIYQYSIDGGVNFSSNNHFTGLTGGDYSVLVKDANNCYSEIELVTILPGEPLSFTIVTTDVSCFGGNTGQIKVTASGGTPPYVYSKDNGATYQPSNVFTGLSAGIYSVLIKDAHDCISNTLTVPISEPVTGITASATITDVLCHGESTGEINIQATGGTSPYEYSVDGGNNYQTSPDFNSLPAGNYSIVVRDYQNCTFSFVEVIAQPLQALSFNTSITDVLCFGDATGSIEIIAVGGTPNYEYSINNGVSFQSSNLFENLLAGDYDIVVRDANSCTSSATVSITEPSAELSFTTTITDVLCYGESTGAIEITATGGTTAYEYSINNGSSYQSSNLFENLLAGDYDIVVRDANSCTSSATVSITEPTAELSFTTTITDVLCYGESTGAIEITATGGTTAYEYSINNGSSFQSSNLFENLLAGDYDIVVRDANSCTSSATVSIAEPSAELSFTTTITDVLCYGESTGAIEITATGGTTAYEYSINNGVSYQSSNLFENLLAGDYDIVVRDANNCTSSATVSIAEPSAELSFTTTITDVLCYGESTGAIEITATGGTPAYEYSINNGSSYQSSNLFENLLAGDYEIVVRDANSCTSSATVSITEPSAELSFTTTITDVLCYGESTGAIEITATGGTTAYEYSINNGVSYQSSNLFENLLAGDYDIVVRDANSCTSSATVSITEPSAELSFTTTITDVLCYGESTGAIEITATGGTTAYEYSINNGSSYQSSNLFENLLAGDYDIVVRDANSCTSSATVSIAEPSAELSFTTTITDVLCYGESTGAIEITATGGTTAYEYSINNGSSYQSSNLFENLLAGDYDIVVRDANSCTSSATVSITEPSAELSFTTTITDVLCYGESTGAIEITATGGTPAYEYSINNGSSFQSSNLFENLLAGDYDIVVRDANSCTSSATVSITESNAGLSFTTTITDVLCYGENTGSIEIDATGGTSPYMYSINGGYTYESINLFENLSAGTYSIVVYDANACYTSTVVVIITEPAAAVDFSVDVNSIQCYGETNGSIIISANGGTPPYQYSIDNGVSYQSSNNFTNLSAGIYNVIVKDQSDCESYQMIDLTQPDELLMDITVTDVDCFGGNNGSIEIDATGGTTPYQYSINGGLNFSTNNIFTGLLPGDYDVLVVDDNNCNVNELVQIIQPSSLPEVYFENLNLEYCLNSNTVFLIGNQAPEGSFTGPGITDHGNGTATFDPMAAGVGSNIEIVYFYTSPDGCFNSDTQETEVLPIPDVSFALLNDSYCIDYGNVLLTGNHAPNGTFDGIGVFDNGDGTAIFDPSAAGVGGPYQISYTYSDGNNCANIAIQETNVYPVPIVNFSGLDSDYCIDEGAVTLIGNQAPNGIFTGPGITDNGNGTALFDPAIAGVGNNIGITYTYTNSYFCINSKTKYVDIHALPQLSILNLYSNYCVNDADVTIIGNPLPTSNSTAIFSGDGITDNGDGTAIFSPSSLTENNIYTITYSFVDSNTCENSISKDVNIIDLPDAPLADDVTSCFGETVPNLVATGLPGYQITWYNSVGDSVYSGNTYPTGLTAVGDYEFYVSQVHPVTDCESNTRLVTLSIVDLPDVSLSSYSDMCIYDLIIFLTNGTPTGGDYSGNSGIVELPGGDYLFHPQLAGVGTHNIVYTYVDPVTGCQDTAMKTITVHDRPDVSILDLEDVYCVNGVDVVIHGNHTGYGSFSGAGITDNGDGSAIFSPSVADLGSHQIIYEYQDINTSCLNQDTSVTIVEGAPESVNSIMISDPEICVNTGGNVTLEAVGGDGTWVNWFEGSCEGNDPEILSANGDSSLIIIPAPTNSTYYYAQWETECGVSEFCAEDYILVTQIPTSPDTSWVTPNIICNNDQDSVALYIIGGNYGTTLKWTQDSCTGQVVGQTNGDPLIIASPDTTTRYFAKWINECGESECTESIRVLVTLPAEEIVIADADSNYFCANTLNNIELRAFGGRGDTIIWYYDSLGYDPVPIDSVLSVSYPLGDTIEIIPPTVHTSFYPFRATPCEQVGGNVSVDLFVFNEPHPVDSAYALPPIVCFGETDSITLIADGGAGSTLEWYSGSCENGVFLGSGNNFKINPPNVTTNYFARWTSPCGVSDCFETTVEIYPSTTDPVMIASDTNEICAGNIVDIQLVMVGGSGDSVVWFSDYCGGTQLDGSTFYYQSENADTIVIPAPTTDTTFYAQWATQCEVSECVSIDITVYPQPEIMDTVFTNYNNFCSGSVNNITLTAIGGSGDEISWTKNSCDGPIVAVTNQQSITIPAPMDTTVYFAKWKTLCDSTDCHSIQVNVPPTPQDPNQIQIMESLICDNVVDSITMILQGGSGYEAVWFYGAYCGNDTIPDDAMNKLSANGDTIRIARPAQSLVITANWASYNGVCGSSECVSTEVFVYEAPLAYFEISGGEACENTLLQFAPDSDAGTGLITNLHWDFGDGTIVDTNLQVSQYHLYELTGLYDVELQVTNTYGCQDTLIIPLDISEAPEALFSYNATCLGEPVQFIDESISAVDSIAFWFWDFGDASSNNDTSSLQNPNYTYQQPGIYNVTLSITDTSGCTNQVIQEVNIAPKPTAYFNLETASCQNVPVFFNDSSYTEFNEIGTWIWNFGDGSPDSVITAPNNPDVWYTYSMNGDFTVSLTVIDTSGCYGETYYQYFDVKPQPIAGFTFSDTACQTGIINFFDTTYHEPGTVGEAWSWSFGDGGFAYQQNPVHSYIETGQFYDVQMIVTDEYGCQDTAAHEIEVQPELVISFSSNLVCEGEPTEMIANVIQPEGGTVDEWEWHFGDNSDTIVSQDTIYHTYNSGGTFYVTLVGVDDGGCETIVINQPVLVNPAPLVDFFIPEASCNDPSIFYDHSVANADMISSYHFDYGDGTYENYTNENYNDPIEHNYPAGANEYIATITLVNSNGCESVQEFVVERESCITMDFSILSPACINQEMMFVNNSTINNEQVTIDSIFWDFGDGVIYELPIADGDTVYHTYESTGMMEVKMTLFATNQFGDFSRHSLQYIYVNESPNAEFTIDQNLLCSRDSIQFTDHSWVFNGEIVEWKWEFGDAMIDDDTSSKQHPQYWYSYEGTYTPTLIAISDSGCMSTFEEDITLEPSPINHLFANVEYGCGPQNEILFKDTAYLANGNIAYYQWIFGFNDTVYTEEDNLLHQLNIGEYNVISRVVSEIGCTGVDSLSGFNVYDKPIAQFSYYPVEPTIHEPEVFFNDQSIGAESMVEYYHWDFGDDADTVGLDPVHIYQDTGLFNVLLTIQDENGCVDTISHSIYVDPVFSFYIPNAFSPNGNGLNDEFGPIGSYFADKDYEFQIFSRWGELLFETRDPFEYWKGDFSLTTKNPVPLGVYSWIIRVEDAIGDEHLYKGQVTVVR